MGTDCSTNGDCNYHGYCSEGICSCDYGYSGSTCQYNACTYSYECGYGYCSSGTCVCNPGYTGPFCDMGTDCSTNGDCNYNGYCSNGICHCDSGYSGSTCQDYFGWNDDKYDSSDSSGETTYIQYIVGVVIFFVVTIAICIIRLRLRSRGRNVTSTSRFTTVTTGTSHPVVVGTTVPPQPPSSQQPYQHYPSWYEPFQGSQQNRRADTTVPIVITPPQPSAPAIEQPPAYNSVSTQPGEESLPPPPSYDAAMEMREGDVTGNIPNLYSAPQPALAREDDSEV
ncbi:uncharacterized protein LOC100376225 [Saccoglossus kowalevskii]|uniref:Delta-like protein D-like n=1 Tax=Saccoglossus kowalevskii TaxID=10224 RepID=A0ABM0MJV5_SACKO|nr:PREDICTED: delta-like protein D-like [Saccoglossus kowalevskii]